MQIIQGNTKSFKLTVYDLDGVALDITAATIKVILWAKGAAAAALSFTEADTANITRNADGTLDVFFSATNTELTLGQYRLEVRVAATLSSVDYAVSRLTDAEVVDAPSYDGLGA